MGENVGEVVVNCDEEMVEDQRVEVVVGNVVKEVVGREGKAVGMVAVVEEEEEEEVTVMEVVVMVMEVVVIEMAVVEVVMVGREEQKDGIQKNYNEHP